VPTAVQTGDDSHHLGSARDSILAAIPAALLLAMFATPGYLMGPAAVVGLVFVGLVRTLRR